MCRGLLGEISYITGQGTEISIFWIPQRVSRVRLYRTTKLGGCFLLFTPPTEPRSQHSGTEPLVGVSMLFLWRDLSPMNNGAGSYQSGRNAQSIGLQTEKKSMPSHSQRAQSSQYRQKKVIRE